MTALALPWFEDENPRDLVRWAMAAAVVLGIHAALISGYLFWHYHPDEIGDDTDVVTVELAPIDSTADADQSDVAPAPEEMIEQKAAPDVEKPPEEPKIEEPPPPEMTTTDVAPPEEKPPRTKPVEQKPPGAAQPRRA